MVSTEDIDNLSFKSANDDDDDDNMSTSGSYTKGMMSEERDEVKEVQKMTQKDTRRVFLWRLAVTGMLLLTAVAITATTYKLLVDEEYNNFETAYEQFARTVGDAAVDQQTSLRNAFRALSHHITAYTQRNNKTWPFVTVPDIEVYGSDTLLQAGTELFNVFVKVENKDRQAWIDYTTSTHEAWVKEGHLLRSGNLDRLNPVGFKPFISQQVNGSFVEDIERDYYFCAWHMVPTPTSYGLLNWNIASYRSFDTIFQGVMKLKNETLVSPVGPYVAVPIALTQEEHDAMHSKLLDSQSANPHSFVYTPVHERIGDTNSPIRAIIGTGTAWDRALINLLPDNVKGIIAVIRNNCNQSYTYEINGKDAIYWGEGDRHDPKFDSYKREVSLAPHTHPEFESTPGHCQYTMDIYPSRTFQEEYDSTTPEIFAICIAATFGLVTIAFFVYDFLVQRRNTKLVQKAAKSNAIVSSMFPSGIRDRLIGQDSEPQPNSRKAKSLKAFMVDGERKGSPEDGPDLASKPLADLFLETTVCFADVVGFTAWSSTREPSQVFLFLESVYSEFDKIARARGVFKVETVGDCYVAVSGLPNPRKDHAVAMARFCRDIMIKMATLVKKLEVTLGPDTGELSLRIGMHSGPVTAGMLRGERTRFQLFGDTINTCARIESTGFPGRIQCSKDTADLLVMANKAQWVRKRDERISAKGKGDMETYWLSVSGNGGSVVSGASPDDPLLEEANQSGLDERTRRLVDWNVDSMSRLLKQIIARRASNPTYDKPATPVDDSKVQKGETFFDEVREIIYLPTHDHSVEKQQDPNAVELPGAVVDQLRDYVSCVARLYRDNPFHNFDHASHVALSVMKLLSRIVAPSHLEEDELEDTRMLHDHTYGITSDPLTQFACFFAALVHDVDHVGVPNATLIKENAAIASLYQNRSVAEQNSLELSWDLLMDSRFAQLRGILYTTEEELNRFRQLLVNVVLATDICDKDLKQLRNKRWEKAFSADKNLQECNRDVVNRKATIVIEHLIQASDVSHTMQHWHIYRKWNECFFQENYRAFVNGRADKDPSEYWYEGEKGFFDFYIIPLAKKLKDCGVFGKSSDEYLNYALQNRKEWEERGKEVVAEMAQNAKRKIFPNTRSS